MTEMQDRAAVMAKLSSLVAERDRLSQACTNEDANVVPGSTDAERRADLGVEIEALSREIELVRWFLGEDAEPTGGTLEDQRAELMRDRDQAQERTCEAETALARIVEAWEGSDLSYRVNQGRILLESNGWIQCENGHWVEHENRSCPRCEESRGTAA